MRKYEFTSAKLTDFVEYFTSETRVDRTNPKYAPAIKFQKMRDILESGNIDVRKIKAMSDLFPHADDFKRQYSFLEKLSRIDDLDVYPKAASCIYHYYKDAEEKGLKERAIELVTLEQKGYYDDYIYAEDFVTQYINFDESPYMHDFLEDTNLTRYIFDRFVRIIAELNTDLFEKYLEKVEINRILRKIDIVRKLENLNDGVTNGTTKDGQTFDEVEFFKNIPFFDRDSSEEAMDDFGLQKPGSIDHRLKILSEHLQPDNYARIMQYVFDKNYIFGIGQRNMTTESTIRSTKYIIGEKELTDEDKNRIINYMRENKIPFLSKAFLAVRSKYLTEGLELTINGVKEKVKKEK